MFALGGAIVFLESLKFEKNDSDTIFKMTTNREVVRLSFILIGQTIAFIALSLLHTAKLSLLRWTGFTPDGHSRAAFHCDTALVSFIGVPSLKSVIMGHGTRRFLPQVSRTPRLKMFT